MHVSWYFRHMDCLRDCPIFRTDLQIRTTFRLQLNQIRTFATKKICTPMNFHLSIKSIPNRKFINGNITLVARRKKNFKMKEQCDEILKQYGILACTDFLFPLKSEHPVSVNPPTHPIPNFVRICKSIRNIGQSLINYILLLSMGSDMIWTLLFCISLVGYHTCMSEEIRSKIRLNREYYPDPCGPLLN